MGKQVSTLKMTGSFAGAVGYIDNQGRIQMRSKTEKYHDANTKAQKSVRVKFLAITGLASAFKNTAIGLLPAAKSSRITLRNMFTKTNYRCIEATAPQGGNIEAETDFTLLQVAKGSNPQVSFGSPQFDEPLTVAVNFGANTDLPGASGSDLVYIVVYNPADNRCLLSTPVRRDVTGGAISVRVPNSWNGETVHVYGFSQGFKSEGERVKYLSVFNDATIAGGEAKAELSKLAADTEFSDSHYIGNGSIS